MHILKQAPLSFNVAFRANVMEMILQLFIYHNVTWDIFNEAISKQAIVCIKYTSLYCIILAKYFLVYQVILLKTYFAIHYAQSFYQPERVNFLCKRYIIFSYSYVMPFNILTKGKIIRTLLKLNTKEYLKVRHFIWLLEV